MDFGVTLTFDLNDADEAVRSYCSDVEKEVNYTDLIEQIESDLYLIDGVEQVMFNHISWIKVNFGDLELHEVDKEAWVVEKEIKAVFEKNGVTI